MLTVKEINEAYKQRFAQLEDELGHTPNPKDESFWELGEWFKSAHQLVIEERNKKAIEKEKEANKESIFCESCGDEIIRKSTRGRKPKFCSDCKKSK